MPPFILLLHLSLCLSLYSSVVGIETPPPARIKYLDHFTVQTNKPPPPLLLLLLLLLLLATTFIDVLAYYYSLLLRSFLSLISFFVCCAPFCSPSLFFAPAVIRTCHHSSHHSNRTNQFSRRETRNTISPGPAFHQTPCWPSLFRLASRLWLLTFSFHPLRCRLSLDPVRWTVVFPSGRKRDKPTDSDIFSSRCWIIRGPFDSFFGDPSRRRPHLAHPRRPGPQVSIPVRAALRPPGPPACLFGFCHDKRSS